MGLYSTTIDDDHSGEITGIGKSLKTPEMPKIKLSDIPLSQVKTGLNRSNLCDIANSIQKQLSKCLPMLDHTNEQIKQNNNGGDHSSTGYMTDFVSAGRQVINQLHVVNAERLSKYQIAMLEALDKILKGKFNGKCRKCSEPIAMSRLLEVPCTAKCTTCKKSEKN